MLYKQFAALKPDYQTIIVSPTELERALVPTPTYMKQQDIKKQACTFWVGNIVEDIARHRVQFWQEDSYKVCTQWRKYLNPSLMEFYSGKDNALDKQFAWVYEWLEKISDLFEPYQNIWLYNLRSQNSLALLDCSGYQVILKWELDFWLIDGNTCLLFDCKTAKQKWDTNMEWCHYQSRFYPFLQMLANPELQEVTFSYLIVIKNKTPKLQELKITVTRDEAEQFVRWVLKEYLTKIHSWEIIPSEWALDRL